MVEEAVALARLAGPPKRIVSCVAPHHIYGFLHTVVSAVALGLETLDMRSVPPGSTPSRLRPGDLVVATPHIWSLMAEGEGRFPDGVAGMTSTAPMSVDLCDRLGRLGLSRILEIYGSSETSGVGWRTDLNAPYQLLPWCRRQDDRIARSDGIARGLPDVVQWTDDSHLRPLRREDGAIQVAGVNVYPSRVAEAIRRHPSVAECIVRRAGVGDASRLEAFVVVGDASADNENFALELANHCQRELSPAERPMRIAIGLDLPFDAMGKPTAW
jgi:4-coumarate--CoA ligase (photoactive yellow protein activation family)